MFGWIVWHYFLEVNWLKHTELDALEGSELVMIKMMRLIEVFYFYLVNVYDEEGWLLQLTNFY